MENNMTPNTIELDEKGIFAYEMPEKPEGYGTDYLLNKWKELCEAAKRDRVYFEPHGIEGARLVKILIEHTTYRVQQGKPYPIPDGYSIKKMLQKRWGDQWHDLPDQEFGRELEGIYQYVAILVPKQEKCEFYNGTGTYIDNDSNRLECPACEKGIVPKEKGAGDDYPVIDLTKNPELLHSYEQLYPKQQSIEEAADNFIDNWVNTESGFMSRKQTFIAGAKSQAAKEYWYEQFKQNIK